MLPYSDTVGQSSTLLLWQFQVEGPNECNFSRSSWIPPFNLLMSLTAVSSLFEISTQILFWEVKQDWNPQRGEGEQLWSDWKGSAGQETHLLLLLETTASTDQKAALQLLLWHREETIFQYVSSTSSILHIPLTRGALYSQQSQVQSLWKDFYSAQTSPYA